MSSTLMITVAGIAALALLAWGWRDRRALLAKLAQEQQAQSQLRDELSQLKSMAASVPDAISIVDSNYVYRIVNDEYLRRNGKAREAIVGRTPTELTGEESFRTLIKPNLDRCLAGETVQYQAWFDYASVGRRYVHVTYAPYRDDQGTITGALVIARDITEQQRIRAEREAAAALRASEQRFRTMADELPLIIWEHVEHVGVAFVNRTCIDYFGVSADDLAGDGWQKIIHPKDRSAYFSAFADSLRTQKAFHAECRARRADGQWRWLESFARPWFDPNGVYSGILGTSIDITDRKQANEALRQSRDELEQRADQLGRLTTQLTLAEQQERRRLAKVLHDHIQQLLVGATLGIERLTRKLDDTGRVELERVKDLLDQSITASRTLVAEVSPPILHDAGLPEALRWLARWMDEHYALKVSLTLDDTLSPNREEIGITLFESAREALFNVVKHAGVTQAEVELTREDTQNLRLVVRDRGVGTDNGESSLRPGGDDRFGLVSVRERLRFLGGRLMVRSDPSVGTEITLIAPIGAAPPMDSLQPTPIEQPCPSQAAQDQVRAIRILLVDDHVIMRQGLSTLLADEPDMEVIGEASNGHEAIEQANALKPDLILMDYSMPGMDGVQATQVIHERWPQIKIIALSMYEEADCASAMLNAGASSYISKTRAADELVTKIRA